MPLYLQAILRCERYISEARDRGEIEDLDTERPMELAEKTLAHLNFSGKILNCYEHAARPGLRSALRFLKAKSVETGLPYSP